MYTYTYTYIRVYVRAYMKTAHLYIRMAPAWVSLYIYIYIYIAIYLVWRLCICLSVCIYSAIYPETGTRRREAQTRHSHGKAHLSQPPPDRDARFGPCKAVGVCPMHGIFISVLKPPRNKKFRLLHKDQIKKPKSIKVLPLDLKRPVGRHNLAARSASIERGCCHRYADWCIASVASLSVPV